MSDHPVTIELHAEAGKRVASGHVKRCRTITDALIRHGAEARLITDTSPASLVSSQDAGNDHHPDLVLVDSYDIDADYLREAKKIINGAKLAYIDDLEQIDLSENGLVNVVISYLPEPDEKRYSGVEYRLLGPMYAPLREEFCISDSFQSLPPCGGTSHSTVSDHIIKDNASISTSLLLTSGATDRYHWKEALLGELVKISPFSDIHLQTLNVIVGTYEEITAYEDLINTANHDHIQSRTASQPNSERSADKTYIVSYCLEDGLSINLYQDVTDMASLMRSSGIAVSGGGTTLYELCAMGVPTIIRPGSDWEQNFASAMSRASGMPLVQDIDQTLSELTSLLTDPTARIALADRMHALTDGHGADRIAKALMNIVNG